jgi:RNA polymerase sigma factor (sigma-70 family)
MYAAPSQSQEDTAALCRRCQAGDRSAADEIVRRHMGLVWRAAAELGRPGDDDLAQAGRLGLWYAARRYDPARSPCFSTIACTAIKQHMFKELARQASQAIVSPSSDLLDTLSAPGTSGDRTASRVVLARVLRLLPEKYHSVMEALYAGNECPTFREVAAKLGITRAAAKTRHRDAMRLLRRICTRRGLTQ